MTVQRAGSDTIDVGHVNATSVVVGAGRTLRLLRAAGASLWHMVSAPAVDTSDVGRVGIFAMSTAPTGWLKANGALVSRTAYAALFAAIGTQYGVGDGSTTFALPDLRGEFLRGWDDGRGVDVGRLFGSAQGDAIRNIAGQLGFGAQLAAVQTASGAFSAGSVSQWMPQQATVNAAGIGVLNFNASGSVPTAAENRPRNVALLFCIKF